MTDKDRQRQRVRLAPHGRMRNWVLIVVAGIIGTLAAMVAGSIG